MKYLTIVLLMCISYYAHAQDNAKDILEKAAAAMRSHKSLSYTATLRIKYAQANDTNTHSSIVHMIRDERDTMIGGMVWQSDGIDAPKHYSFYDLDMRYIVMHPQRKVWKEKMDHSEMGLKIINKHLLFYTFLKPTELLKNHFEDVKMLNDTLINAQGCYAVKTSTSSGFDNIGPENQTWYFSKKDMFPILIINATRIDDGIQYSERRFISHEFDKVSKEQFSSKQIPADYLVASRPPNVVIDTREKK